MKHLKGLIIALRTLTSLPMPDPGVDNLALSLPWFPLVGFLLGSSLLFFGYLWTWLSVPEWPAGIALLLLIMEIILTRGLHLDGLADWADSLGAIKEREKKLAIMKDVNLGAFGVVALLTVFLSKWIVLERILVKDMLLWIPLVFIMPKTSMVELISTLPYARPEKGTASPFVKNASPKHRLMSHLFTLFLCLFFGPYGIMFYALSLIFTFSFRRYCRRVFGGITGDLLGTANELMEISLLFVLALFADALHSYLGWSWLL